LAQPPDEHRMPSCVLENAPAQPDSSGGEALPHQNTHKGQVHSLLGMPGIQAMGCPPLSSHHHCTKALPSATWYP
jgi:hypothetical protein